MTPAAQALAAAHPHLMPVWNSKGGALTAAASNVRIELRAAFPGVKFSVRTSRFSMGDSMSIRWTDGPTADQVAAITGRYAAGTFDGMDDSFKYEKSDWRDAFGQARHVFDHRDNSAIAIASALRTLRSQHPGEVPESIDFRDYEAGRLQGLYRPGAYPDSIHAEISRIMAHRTWCLTRKGAT